MALTYVGDASQQKPQKGKGQSKGQSGAGRRESRASQKARQQQQQQQHQHQQHQQHQQQAQYQSPAQVQHQPPPPSHGYAQTQGVAPPPQRNIPLSRTRNLTVRSKPTGKVEPLGRSSVKSKASSSSSSDKKQGRIKMLKNCCRKTVEFMFTQVGVGAVVVFYTLMGASIFQYIETLTEDPSLMRVEQFRNETVRNLWNLTNHYNVLNKGRWKNEISKALLEHELEMVRFVQEEGYDQRSNAERWNFSSALMFALSVITMIGYGAVVPRTETGKITCIVYACVGIPVYILYFMNMGKVFAIVLKWVYTKAYRWNVRRKWKQSVNYDAIISGGDDAELDAAYLDELEAQVIVPSTTCLWVMTFYLIVGTIMFAEWENWNYLDSTYFCVTSLCKIGFGDFVPGSRDLMKGAVNDQTSDDMAQVKLVITFVYLLVGMGVVAMCYYLLKEEVTVRLLRFKDRMKIRITRLKIKLGLADQSALQQLKFYS